MTPKSIIGPLILESKRGYKNDSVIGGLDKFVLNTVKQIECDEPSIKKIKEIFSLYSEMSTFERQNAIDEALQILKACSQPLGDAADKHMSVSLASLFRPIDTARGIGPNLAKTFGRLGIETVYDLMYYFPRDYLDLRELNHIGSMNSGDSVVLKVKIVNFTERKAGRVTITTALITDGTGFANAVWFNQRYITKNLKEGIVVLLSGKVQFAYGKWEIISPDYEIFEEGKESVHTLRIIPIYSLTQGVSQKLIRNRIKQLIDVYGKSAIDFIDSSVLKKYKFLQLADALENVHFPSSFELLNKARERLIFDELFELELMLGSRRLEIKKLTGIKLDTGKNDIEEFESFLSFKLTGDQIRAMKEIMSDFTSGKPMNRLLHGDVGSGKTVVALFAIYIAAKNGYQSVLMSPTEILAQQTYNTAEIILTKAGLKVALLTSSTSPKERKVILNRIIKGELDSLFGTHALIEKDVQFSKLGVVIVDEQHRFGVMQRGALRSKADFPHTLVMSATPIPRTLALTLYGDLDITQIREMPEGRKPIFTKVFFENEDRTVYNLLANELKEGRKAYVVCPLIEDSDELELQSVERRIEDLKNNYLSGFELGMLHGGMSSEEKKNIMEAFRYGDLQVLVSTTVVEVGVDVSNATVIVIEDADRFGLATLHQLRGRVGRSELQSYCYLITRNPSEEAIKRLRVLEKTSNGFEVSEEDLKLRGPGEILGTKQSGIPELKLANLVNETDLRLLEIAREEAIRFVNNEVEWEKNAKTELLKILKEKFKNKIFLGDVA
ncbi:MAG: ATP-dependent DNA helicase RecG [Caldisericaceae bacterium]